MRTKLLRKLRKRFEIHQYKEYYYVVDNDSLHWDNTYPYKYQYTKNLNKAESKRRQLILDMLPVKTKKIR